MTIVAKKRFALLLLVLASLPVVALANKRHAVAPSIAMVMVTGKVTDVDTGAPVVFAQVVSGPRTSTTDSQGMYRILVPVGLTSAISVGRSGYETTQIQVIGKDGLTINFTLKSKPTVKVLFTNGTSYDADLETARFEQEIPFSNSSHSLNVILCKADGTKFTVSISDFAKITGPALSVTNQACCTATPVLKVTTDLKNGQHDDVTLAETCTGVFMDFGAVNHLTGEFMHTRFENIQEIDFP